ncbi:hypothetical protein M9Y10_045978 [Tritrichomonas musculus]|uniref:Importin N-terminal domain-containing protein n=1 Tax=Tritrichomonas musculus TaxID=1915356 RepID=A0ABR2JWX9_9EUKA
MVETLFNNFIANDGQCSYDASTALMLKIQNEPMFLQDLFSFLEQALELNAEPTLIKLICVAIYKIIDIYGSQYTADPVIYNYIFSHLLKDTFLLPFEDKQYLSVLLIKLKFLHDAQYSIEVFKTCFEQVMTNSLTHISTSLYILYKLIDTCAISNRCSEIQQFYSIIIERLYVLVNQFIVYFEKHSFDLLDENKQQEFETCHSSFSSIVDLFSSLILRIQILNRIDYSYFFKIIEQFIYLLPKSFIPYKLQDNFAQFIKSFISILFQNHRSDSTVANIKGIVENQYKQLIGQSVFSCFTLNNLHPIVCSRLFDILHRMIIINWFREMILSPEFISNCIIPSCRFQSDYDQLTFVDTPHHFIENNYPFDNADPGLNIIRFSVYDLLRVVGLFYDTGINTILQCCVANIGTNQNDYLNQIDLESRLFVISCVTKCCSDNQDIYNFLFSKINSNIYPPFVIATAIYGLLSIRINKLELNRLSIDIIVNSDKVVLKLLAVRLFRNTFDKTVIDSTIESIFPALLNTLLALLNNDDDEEIISAIELLIFQFPYLIEICSIDLVAHLFNIWKNTIESVDYSNSEESGKFYFDLIHKLFLQMPQNSKLFTTMWREIFGFFINIFNEIKTPLYAEDYFNFIATFFIKLDLPNPDLFEIVPFICEYFGDDIEQLESPSFVEALRLLTSIIQKPNFYDYKDGQLGQMIFQYFGNIASNTESETFKMGALLIFSTMVQLNRVNLDVISNQPLEYFSQLDIGQPQFYVSELVLLSSILLTNPNYIIEKMNEQILNNIFNNSHYLSYTQKNYIKICLIGLLIISKYQNQDAYLCAVKVLKDLFQVIQNNNKSSESDFNDADTEDLTAFADITPNLALPSDNKNPFDFFMATSYETEFYRLLPNDEFQFIQYTINQLSKQI